MKIEPLSKRTLDKAITLIINVFHSKPSDLDYPGKWLPLSLKDHMDEKIDDSSVCTSCKYYLGIDEKTGEIIGITGIYTIDVDEEDSDWIAWYCVDNKYRGKGYGSKLLDYVIDLSKKRGKRYLKLYTSYNTDIEDAMALYKKRGFHITKESEHPQTGEEMIFMKLDFSKIKK